MNQAATRIAMERLHDLLNDLRDMGEYSLVELIHQQFRTGHHSTLYAQTFWERPTVRTMTPAEGLEILQQMASKAKEHGATL